MSIRLMNDAWDTDLQATEKLVLLTLCDFANDEGRNCYPSVPTIASKATLSERQTQRVLRALESSGLISVSAATANGGRGVSKHYSIAVQKLAALAGEARARREALKQDEKGVNLSPFCEDQKGDMDVTVSAAERVTSETKRVTPVTQKGDTHVTRSINNHHNSNHQRGSRASAREPAPQSGPVRLFHGVDPLADALAPFPVDWQPDEACKAILDARRMAMPDKAVIDRFAAHWADRLIAPRRIPNEFAKWVAREHTHQLGQHGAPKPRPVVSADAEQAWEEVRRYGQRGELPAKWSDERTRDALQAIGGFRRIEDMLTRDVPFVRREFIAAFCDEGRKAA